MTGGLVLLRKELLESWRTLRLPIVAQNARYLLYEIPE